MLKNLMRIVLTVLGGLLGYSIYKGLRFVMQFLGLPLEQLSAEYRQLAVAFFVALMAIIAFKLTPSLGRQSAKVARNIDTDLKGVSKNEIITGTFGLIVGLVIAFLISQIYEGIGSFPFKIGLTLITYLILGFLGITIATKKFGDLNLNLASFLKTSGKSKGKNSDAMPKILDTSVIIDGRISDIMKTGFIEGDIVIPEFVLLELQHIADSSDGLKRARGRRGLDILKSLQDKYNIEIYNTASEKSLEEIPEVDIKLLKLAQIINGKVVTNDFNLNKVARIKEVDVLNINELANTLKPVVLPGEEMQLFLVKEGKEYQQALAYLDDGTMIVVEDGKKYIGKKVKAVVTSVLQTSAGRMIFCRMKEEIVS